MGKLEIGEIMYNYCIVLFSAILLTSTSLFSIERNKRHFFIGFLFILFVIGGLLMLITTIFKPEPTQSVPQNTTEGLLQQEEAAQPTLIHDSFQTFVNKYCIIRDDCAETDNYKLLDNFGQLYEGCQIDWKCTVVEIVPLHNYYFVKSDVDNNPGFVTIHTDDFNPGIGPGMTIRVIGTIKTIAQNGLSVENAIVTTVLE